MSQLESAPPDESRGTEVPRSLETRSCAPPMEKERLPHSRWGCLSFILPFLFIVVLFAYFIVSDIVHSLGDCSDCRDDLCFFGLEIAFWGSTVFYFASIVPFVFSIVGLCQPRTRKIFCILGFCLSAPLVAFLVCVVIPTLLGL